MEKRSGVFMGSKEGGKATSKEYDVGLGLRMQAKESCTHHEKRVMMLMSPHHHEPFQLLSSSSCSGDDGSSIGGFGGLGFEGDSGGGGGTMFCSTSNPMPVACLGDIYDVVGAVSASGSVASDAVAVSKSLHHLTSDSPSFTFSSTGEMTPTVNVRVPFTAAQRQELERQTMIYKYMMASIPVPPELLIPITKKNAPPSQSNIVTSSLEMGISSHNSDPEPWRCKRTDGKKWRCSRDVAPDQKYCERHSHKSRPRSRKPVELHTDSMINITKNHNTNSHSLNQKSHFPSQTNCNLSMFPRAVASAANTYDQPRSLDWFLKGETAPFGSNSKEEWQHLKRFSNKSSDRVYNFQHHCRDERLNTNSYSMNSRGVPSLQTQRLNEQCSLLLNPKSTSVEVALNPSQTEPQETRHFIDAWSSAMRETIGAIGNECTVSSSEKLLPLSSLTLSMAGGSETNEENENTQVGSFGVMGSDRDQSVGVLRPPWTTHGSWMGSPPGGPLAEALCLGISSSASTASNLSSPHGSGYGSNANKN